MNKISLLLITFCAIPSDADDKSLQAYVFREKYASKKFEDANETCVAQGLRLAELTSIELAEYIKSVIKNYNENYPLWIGCSDLANKNSWKWNGRENVNMTWGWYGNKPNGDNEHCVGATREGWKDYECSRETGYICEFENAFSHVFILHIERYVRKNYAEAVEACNVNNSQIVQIKTNATNEFLLKLNYQNEQDPLWIGGNETVNNAWKWNNGDPVNRTWGWEQGEPKSNEKINRCLCFTKNGWSAKNCSDNLGYICNKGILHPVTTSETNLVVSEGGINKVICEHGSPDPNIKITWLFRGKSVPTSPIKSRVYQSNSTLHAECATKSDEGIYTCVVSYATGYRRNATVDVKVSMRPHELSAEPFSCNSSLRILWTVDKRAVNVTHKVTVENENETFHQTAEYDRNCFQRQCIFAITRDLPSFASHNITITPCPDQCQEEYSLSKSVYTGGIPTEVKNITAKTLSNSSCYLEWEPPFGDAAIHDLITGYQVTILENNGLHFSSTTVNVTMPETSWEHHHKKNWKYSFEVRAKTCAGIGESSRSKDDCHISEKTISSAITISVVLSLVVLFLIAFGIFLWKRKKGRLSTVLIKHDDEITKVTLDVIPQKDEVIYVNSHDSKREETKVKICDFEEYYNKMQEEDGRKFISEFQKLLNEAAVKKRSTEIASLPEFKQKNRYKNILPYDCTRVILENTHTGYINACFINGFRKAKKFIATQGPLTSTTGEFWTMVYEQKCPIIVMLCKCMENGKKKCEKYWPDHGKSVDFGLITVENVLTERYGGYVKRKLKMTVSLKDQDFQWEVLQFHFTSWPDHGVPVTTSNLLKMHRNIMSIYDSVLDKGPIIVHCNAGTGRTGTFIGCDILFEESLYEENIDVYNTVIMMRNQRVDMVQNTDQYILLHKLLLEVTLFGDTDLSMDNARKKFVARDYRKIMSEQFDNLSRVKPLKTNMGSAGCKSSSYERKRIVVTRRKEDEGAVSMNASLIEAYGDSNAIIAAQEPSTDNAEYFWRTVLDYNVEVILPLSYKTPQEGNCALHFPSASQTCLQIGEVKVQFVEKEKLGIFEKLKLSMDGYGKEISVICLCPTREVDEMEPSHIIEIHAEMLKIPRRSQHPTTMICCKNGRGFTGMFCAVLNLIERVKVENRVDVFSTVKDLRDCRRGMVQTLDEYKLCHDAITEFVDSLDTYANFR